MAYILASASPRRKELLKFITEDFLCIPADIDETGPSGIKACKLPEYLALEKARHIASLHPEDTVIGSDTGVICDGIMLGKPADKDDAFRMLKMLSGREHSVITGCAAVKGDREISFSVETKVRFYELSDTEIEQYISTNECFDKAGSYGIQGYGSLLVKEISGDYFNVVGLPVAELSRALKKL